MLSNAQIQNLRSISPILCYIWFKNVQYNLRKMKSEIYFHLSPLQGLRTREKGREKDRENRVRGGLWEGGRTLCHMFTEWRLVVERDWFCHASFVKWCRLEVELTVHVVVRLIQSVDGHHFTPVTCSFHYSTTVKRST